MAAGNRQGAVAAGHWHGQWVIHQLARPGSSDVIKGCAVPREGIVEGSISASLSIE